LAKFWLSMLTELRNRGPRDILICCCDGLSGLLEAITTAFPSPRPDVDAMRDHAQVLRARLEEIAREFTDDPAMPVTMVRTMTERAQAKLGDIEPS
jgi:hypothetical protein